MALCNLGATLRKLERYLEAEENLQIALKIFRKTGARPTEVIALYNLAEISQNLGDSILALKYCVHALSIAIELDIPLQKECRELKQQLEYSDE